MTIIILMIIFLNKCIQLIIVDHDPNTWQPG